MIIKTIKRFWTATVARQLILGVALVHAVLMSIFVFDLVSRQREFMMEQNNSQAVGLAETLSANGVSWMLSNDFVGLEEVIRSQSRFPGLDYAMFLDMNGKVLGYTERDKVGLYTNDPISKKLIDSPPKNVILIDNQAFIDVASPVMISGLQIGWARVGINRQDILQSLVIVTKKGLIYTIVAILIGVIFALFMAKGLTASIRKLTLSLQKIISGYRDVHLVMERHDEVGELSHDFNLMVQSIKDKEEKIKKANEALVESEVKFRRLVNNLSTEYFLFSHDINGVFNYVTPSVKSVLGYGVDEFKIHCHSFLTANPENEKAKEHNRRSITGSLEPSYEIEVYHKSGDKIWLNISEAPVVDENGKVIGVEGIAHDVSQRKNFENILLAKEQEQSEILDNMLDGVITLNDQGNITGCNYSAQKLFGYQKSELHEKSFSMLFSSDSLYNLIPDKPVEGEKGREQDIIDLIGLRRTDSNEYIVDVDAQNKEGDVFPVRLSLAKLLKTDNVNQRYICTCSDLTEQKHHEERLRRSQKMDALGKLTGGIAHDFNNMLGVIIGYSDLLLMSGKQQPKQHKYVEEIKHAGERGKKLTQKLLGFSRRKEMEAECVDINELLKDNHHMLAKSITSKIELKYKLQEGIWSAWFDKGDMEDALINLSINAMHAMPNGGMLTIETQNTIISPEDALSLNLCSGEYIQVQVTDTGIGMDKSMQHQIFDPFFSTKDDLGTGLGLSQVYGFIQRSGGVINVYSEPGHGSCFSMYFPRYKLKPIEISQDNTIDNNTDADLKGHGELILLVDDENALLSLGEQVLQQNGYKIITAENAEVALNVIETNADEQQAIALMICDVIMPGMDGYQLSEIVSTRYPNIKIQLSSGFNDDRHLNYKNQSLHENLLAKPFTSNELLLRVKNILNGENGSTITV